MATDVTINSLFPAVREFGIENTLTDIFNTTFIGIDFGTSTTVVSIGQLSRETKKIKTEAIWLNQKLSDGAVMSSDKIPSVIAWYNNDLLVGTGAADLKYVLRKGINVWYSFKMELGEDLGAAYYNSELGRNANVTILNAKDATSIFFKYLKTQIDRYIRNNNLPTNIKYAVSIPASFEANQRKELVEALKQNGIEVTKQALIDEPNAAFISYVKETTQEGNPLKLPDDYNLQVLVFDFGAGTCDVSILEIGKDLKGLYSKNLSISRFEKLGGDDIDRYIAIEILFPQLLNENKLKKEDFRTPEINKSIIPRLLKAAEQLKILISKKVGLSAEGRTLPPLSISPDVVTLDYAIEIDTKKGKIKLSTPRLAYKEFYEVMKNFVSEKKLNSKSKYEDQDQYISIFNPVQSALKKANLSDDEIDYVLLIGGSSKNPYIQNALSEFFKDSELLIPRDLQTHVSAGASIHSLLFNGFGKNLIQPITSEPFLLLTKDETPKVILRAGTQIPSELVLIDDLVTDRDGQEIIELPIFIGNQSKMLFNIRIYSNSNNGFKINTPIRVELELNADKLLMIRATVDGIQASVEPLNPFANKALSSEERMILRAEKQANIDAEKNGGTPTKKSLKSLSEVYEKAGSALRAAETLELMSEIYEDSVDFSSIGILYSNAGYDDKAIELYEKALKKNRNSNTILNLALKLRWRNRTKYIKLIQEAFDMDPSDPETLVEMGRIEKNNNLDKATEYFQKAFDIYNRKFELNKKLRDWEYSWFAAVAEELGKHDFAQKIRESKPQEDSEKLYNAKNLVKTQREQGLIKR